MIDFTKKETDFISKKDDCRVATVSDKEWPQVTTVIHILDGGFIYFITEKTTKKVANIKGNNKVAVIVDTYARTPISLNIQGFAEIIDDGPEFDRLSELFKKRHEYYATNGVAKGDDVLVKITPVRKTGFNQ